MNVFDEYTLCLLTELNKNEVEYIVVGGYAVNFYGYRRTTGDIDLWIKPDNSVNKEKLINALRNLKVDEEALTYLYRLDFTTPVVFMDGEEPFKIDFMTYISGIEFNEAWEQKTNAVLDSIAVPFINIKHLILTKLSTGRAKDKIDIEELQRIQAIKKK